MVLVLVLGFFFLFFLVIIGYWRGGKATIVTFGTPEQEEKGKGKGGMVVRVCVPRYDDDNVASFGRGG